MKRAIRSKGCQWGVEAACLFPFFCHLNSIERPSFSIRFHNGHKRRFSGAFDSSRCRSQSRSDKCSVRATLLSAQRKIESSAGRLKNVPIYQFRSKKGTEQPKRTVVLFFVERVSSPPPPIFFLFRKRPKRTTSVVAPFTPHRPFVAL